MVTSEIDAGDILPDRFVLSGLKYATEHPFLTYYVRGKRGYACSRALG